GRARIHEIQIGTLGASPADDGRVRPASAEVEALRRDRAGVARRQRAARVEDRLHLGAEAHRGSARDAATVFAALLVRVATAGVAFLTVGGIDRGVTAARR